MDIPQSNIGVQSSLRNNTIENSTVEANIYHNVTNNYQTSTAVTEQPSPKPNKEVPLVKKLEEDGCKCCSTTTIIIQTCSSCNYCHKRPDANQNSYYAYFEALEKTRENSKSLPTLTDEVLVP